MELFAYRLGYMTRLLRELYLPTEMVIPISHHLLRFLLDALPILSITLPTFALILSLIMSMLPRPDPRSVAPSLIVVPMVESSVAMPVSFTPTIVVWMLLVLITTN